MEALQSPWLKKYSNIDKHFPNEEVILNSNIINNLILFHNGLILAKAVLSFISNNSNDSEEIKRIKIEFDSIDTNKDGYLSQDEIYQSKIFYMIY